MKASSLTHKISPPKPHPALQAGPPLDMEARALPGAGSRRELSPRERQTLELLLAGMSDKEIAERLGISLHTVNQYTKSVYRCFGVGSRAKLMAHCFAREAALPP